MQKMSAGETFPPLSWTTVSGAKLAPANETGWRILIAYRGKHCPICKSYLNSLNEMISDFAASEIKVFVLSADSQEKARAEAEECGWKFEVGYGLSVEEMRKLGLYISEPRSPQKTDRAFAEPALFGINPEGKVQIIDISNAPFSRPDLSSLLKGLQFVIANDYPIRGTA